METNPDRSAVQRRLRRMLAAALFAAALIFIEAGVGALVLGRDAVCHEQADRLWDRFVSDSECLSEEGSQFFHVLLRGPVFAVVKDMPLAAAAAVNVVMYALLGGAASLMKFRWGVLTFFIIHGAFLLGGTLAAVIALYTA